MAGVDLKGGVGRFKGGCTYIWTDCSSGCDYIFLGLDDMERKMKMKMLWVIVSRKMNFRAGFDRFKKIKK